MLKIRVHGLIDGGVTLFHVVPPLVVTWMCPSSVPAHRIDSERGDGESAVMLPIGAGFTVAAYFPALAGTSHVWRVRSGETRVQLCALSVLFQTTLET